MNAVWPLLVRESVGVDMLEWKKARAFYKAHREKLATFLCPAETGYVQSSHRPYESLAMILSAKEAVFKAIGVSWMGISGFERIQILPGKNRFSFRLKGIFSKKFSRKNPLEISFTKHRLYVVAHCHPKLPCAGI